MKAESTSVESIKPISNVDALDGNGETQLYGAAERGDCAEVERLLKEGANVNFKKSSGWTPLMTAACSSHIAVAELLLANGANVNAKEKDYWTPLHQAVRERDIEMASFLIEKGADINAQERYGETVLHIAVLTNQQEMVKLLLDNGANATLRNELGHNPLQAANDHYNEVRQEIKELLRHLDVQVIQAAADVSDAVAQVELGFQYAHGKGVVRDIKKALECFYHAANQGNADAHSILGTIFHEGLWGIAKDYQEALKWHRLAADQGWVPSLLELGLMYDNGRGVPKDGKAAFKWFRVALSEGHGGNTPAHTEQLEKLMAMFLVRIAEACSGAASYDYLSFHDERRDFAREIGTLLYGTGGTRAMKRALDEYVGRIPGQRNIDQFWDGIGDWRG